MIKRRTLITRRTLLRLAAGTAAAVSAPSLLADSDDGVEMELGTVSSPRTKSQDEDIRM